MSLALVLATRRRIVAASDSRAFDAAQNIYTDVTRKVDIHEAGYLFAATGAGDYALDAWHCSPPTPNESAEALAGRMVNTMRDLLLPDAAPFTVLFGIFRFNGRADGFVYRLQVDPAANVVHVAQTAPIAHVPIAMAFGWDDYKDKVGFLNRRVHAPLTRDPNQAAMVTLATKTITYASSVSPAVGGPLHVAVVDGSGARWIEENVVPNRNHVLVRP